MKNIPRQAYCLGFLFPGSCGISFSIEWYKNTSEEKVVKIVKTNTSEIPRTKKEMKTIYFSLTKAQNILVQHSLKFTGYNRHLIV